MMYQNDERVLHECEIQNSNDYTENDAEQFFFNLDFINSRQCLDIYNIVQMSRKVEDIVMFFSVV